MSIDLPITSTTTTIPPSQRERERERERRQRALMADFNRMLLPPDAFERSRDYAGLFASHGAPLPDTPEHDAAMQRAGRALIAAVHQDALTAACPLDSMPRGLDLLWLLRRAPWRPPYGHPLRDIIMLREPGTYDVGIPEVLECNMHTAHLIAVGQRMSRFLRGRTVSAAFEQQGARAMGATLRRPFELAAGKLEVADVLRAVGRMPEEIGALAAHGLDRRTGGNRPSSVHNDYIGFWLAATCTADSEARQVYL